MAALALLVVAIALVGCGNTKVDGSASRSTARSSITRAEFIRRVDAICEQIGRRFHAPPMRPEVVRDLRTRQVKPRDFADVARYTGALIRAAAPEESRVESLDRPPADALLRRWSIAEMRSSATAKNVHSTALSRDLAAFTRALEMNARAAEAYMRLSARAGFRACGRETGN